MTSLQAGQRVTVALPRVTLDGIVFQAAGPQKVIVAVPDRGKGTVLRTVAVDVVSERETDGALDDELRKLIRRTPSTARGGANAGKGAGGAGQAGHNRSPAHRTTGR